jgi:3-deoxy-D-manno-octulosonate 8-phosphate phosphatase (KDO 8-P phosphatase)
MTRPHADPAAVRLLVLDVDGVMTEGDIIYDGEGRELKRYSVRDGFGLGLWHRAGFGTAIITGRGGPVVDRRAEELGIGRVVHRAGDKGAILREVAGEAGVGLGEIAYMGDDWKDIPAMRLAGLPAAPVDAEAPVLELAAFVSSRRGGRGAVRELIEHVLGAKGLLAGLLGEYGYDRP